MQVIGYIRVSTDKQDAEKQRHLLLQYSQQHKLLIDEFTEHLEGLLRIGYEIHPSTVPREDLMSIEVSDLMVSLSELGRDEWEEWLGQTLKAGASYRSAMERVDRFKPAPAAPVAALVASRLMEQPQTAPL